MSKTICSILILCACAVAHANLINSKVERSIDIASQLVKITIKLTLENSGKSPVSSFLHTFDEGTKSHLSYISASQVQDANKVPLKVEDVASTQNDLKDKDVVKIHLLSPLASKESVNVRIDLVFTHTLVPHPSSITQAEKQLIMFHGNLYHFSPHATKTQTTTVTVASNSVESYTKLKPVSHSENVITYGPYDNIAAFSINKMIIHYENNNPFLSVTNLNRAIEVSHWGVISIEEEVDIVHSGAKLKGPFSRYEFQRDQSGIASVKHFRTVLPASANDVYYRDEIGNISTSHLRQMEDSTELELRPRFPLFGGWKTHYTLGYYVPTYEYLYNNGDNYALKLRFVDHIFDDCVVDDIKVRVILPEGSKNIKLRLPYPIQRSPNELHFTYLDTVGRPVIVLSKSNLVEQHIQDFEVHYEYQKILMLQEPLLVVCALYLLFIIVIIYVRLDFSITNDLSKESKLRVTGYLESIHSTSEARSRIYWKFEEALVKFKQNKDLTAYQNLIKKLTNEHKNETQAIADILAKLKQENSDVAEKVSDIQRFDKMYKDYLQQQTVLAEKLIAGKMSKQQYIDSEAAILKKKEDTVEKMSSLLQNL